MDLRTDQRGLLSLPGPEGLELIQRYRRNRRTAVQRRAASRATAKRQITTSTLTAASQLSLADLEAILELASGRPKC